MPNQYTNQKKNDYKIDNQTLIVYSKDGREILFDLDFMDVVKQARIGIKKNGYAQFYINGKTVGVHRFIMNEPYGLEVDHENGNKLDNRKCNLRIVTTEQNQHNRRSAKGYHFDKKSNKWQSKICVKRKYIHLGLYNTEAEARAAYLEAKKIYHPTAPIKGY